MHYFLKIIHYSNDKMDDKSLKDYFFSFLIIIITFHQCSCAADSGPSIVGVYDTPNNQRILNYKGSNVLHCNVTGSIKPEDYIIQWSRENQKIEPKEDDPHFEIKDNDLVIKGVNDDILKDQFSCSLILKSSNNIVGSAQFFLLENQTFANTLGRFKLKDNIEKGLASYYLQIDEAELTDRDKFAALWPFIGICAEVVVLCAIIFIYERKRNKAELDESDTDQSPEQ
ncbi:hypothetical protein O3M35_003731 [Rhynocoris fuscipes]|uniref:Ig-like domain-containing protein n=1 Tax=Rhynocoris fuscipes TaxID=488301 RepID=A0AAW1CG36_9HEMI